MNPKHKDRFHYLVHRLNAMEITREELDELKVLIESVPLKESEPVELWVNVWPKGVQMFTVFQTREGARNEAQARQVSGAGPVSPIKTLHMREVKE